MRQKLVRESSIKKMSKIPGFELFENYLTWVISTNVFFLSGFSVRKKNEQNHSLIDDFIL